MIWSIRYCGPTFITSCWKTPRVKCIKTIRGRLTRHSTSVLLTRLPRYINQEIQVSNRIGDNGREKKKRLIIDLPQCSVWVNDYHLMLLPALLRERLPNAIIGFFLHIPFPSSEIFRCLPSKFIVTRPAFGVCLEWFVTFFTSLSAQGAA
jgi:hypothetical protein